MTSRALAAVLLLSLLSGCNGDSGGPETEQEPDAKGEANYCVAYVRLDAFMATEAERLEEGDEPQYPNPTDAPAFKEFVAAAPGDIQDDLDIAVKAPPASQSELEEASEAIGARLAEDCFVGEDAESPLSAECRERAVAVEQAMSANAEQPGVDLEGFGRECRPETDPYESLSDECVAMVYGHFTSPSVEGIINVGGPTSAQDKAIAARFHRDCGR